MAVRPQYSGTYRPAPTVHRVASKSHRAISVATSVQRIASTVSNVVSRLLVLHRVLTAASCHCAGENTTFNIGDFILATPIKQVPSASYYFVDEGNGEYSSHTTMSRGMAVEFIVEVHAKDRTDKCEFVASPPRKAKLADIKAWFDKHAECVVCDREVAGLNK